MASVSFEDLEHPLNRLGKTLHEYLYHQVLYGNTWTEVGVRVGVMCICAPPHAHARSLASMFELLLDVARGFVSVALEHARTAFRRGREPAVLANQLRCSWNYSWFSSSGLVELPGSAGFRAPGFLENGALQMALRWLAAMQQRKGIGLSRNAAMLLSGSLRAAFDSQGMGAGSTSTAGGAGAGGAASAPGMMGKLLARWREWACMTLETFRKLLIAMMWLDASVKELPEAVRVHYELCSPLQSPMHTLVHDSVGHTQYIVGAIKTTDLMLVSLLPRCQLDAVLAASAPSSATAATAHGAAGSAAASTAATAGSPGSSSSPSHPAIGRVAMYLVAPSGLDHFPGYPLSEVDSLIAAGVTVESALAALQAQGVSCELAEPTLRLVGAKCKKLAALEVEDRAHAAAALAEKPKTRAVVAK